LATAFCGAGGISPLRQSYSEASEAGEAGRHPLGVLKAYLLLALKNLPGKINGVNKSFIFIPHLTFLGYKTFS